MLFFFFADSTKYFSITLIAENQVTIIGVFLHLVDWEPLKIFLNRLFEWYCIYGVIVGSLFLIRKVIVK